MADDLSPDGAPFHGRWWTPNDPDHVVGGRLELSGGAWGLTLYGWLGPWGGARADNQIPACVHGHVGTTPVTLLDTVSGGQKWTNDGPPYEARLWANTVLAGVHADDATLFKSASVRLLHLNEWANRSPWSYPSGDPEGPLAHSVTFTDSDDLIANLPGGRGTLWRSWGQSGGGLSRVTLDSDERVQFDFDQPIDLETVERDYVRPLRSLIELAAAEPSATLEMRVTPAGADEFTSGAAVLSAVARDAPDPKYSFHMLFRLQDVEFEAVLPAWWRLHSEVGIVSDLLARLRDRGHVGAHILSAASAIEAYHRRATAKRRPRSTSSASGGSSPRPQQATASG